MNNKDKQKLSDYMNSVKLGLILNDPYAYREAKINTLRWLLIKANKHPRYIRQISKAHNIIEVYGFRDTYMFERYVPKWLQLGIYQLIVDNLE